ncbi:3-methyl-2-oxobutanoate hydroxymethyltransferase [Eionea flava]
MAYTNTHAQPVTINTLRNYKSEQRRFSCISLYDAPSSALAAQQGIATVLVGDSLGMTVQGHSSTLPVTMEHMLYHTAAVARNNAFSLIIADMPFMSYSTPEAAMSNAALLMQAGAHMVKLEGGAWLGDTISRLSEQGIPVCAHLGLTPQSVNKLGGYKVQGRDEQQGKAIIDDANALEAAGADLLVLECVPATLATNMTQSLSIPTIGIGAGNGTDAQVLVINDLIGLTEKPPKFSKNFLAEAGSIAAAFQAFDKQVKSGQFPSDEHSF